MSTAHERLAGQAWDFVAFLRFHRCVNAGAGTEPDYYKCPILWPGDPVPWCYSCAARELLRRLMLELERDAG